jgi:hypothetical protein
LGRAFEGFSLCGQGHGWWSGDRFSVMLV